MTAVYSIDAARSQARSAARSRGARSRTKRARRYALVTGASSGIDVDLVVHLASLPSQRALLANGSAGAFRLDRRHRSSLGGHRGRSRGGPRRLSVANRVPQPSGRCSCGSLRPGAKGRVAEALFAMAARQVASRPAELLHRRARPQRETLTEPARSGGLRDVEAPNVADPSATLGSGPF